MLQSLSEEEEFNCCTDLFTKERLSILCFFKIY